MGVRTARIAWKTSAIERFHFSASKLYPNFFFETQKKYLRSKTKSEKIFLIFFSKKNRPGKIDFSIEKIDFRKNMIFENFDLENFFKKTFFRKSIFRSKNLFFQVDFFREKKSKIFFRILFSISNYFFGSRKKSWGTASMQKSEIFRLPMFSKRSEHSLPPYISYIRYIRFQTKNQQLLQVSK